jgi:hypothetical protein
MGPVVSHMCFFQNIFANNGSWKQKTGSINIDGCALAGILCLGIMMAFRLLVLTTALLMLSGKYTIMKIH